jgi:hypothetical protein
MSIGLLAVVTSLIWFGGAVGLFRYTYWARRRTSTGAVRFFGGMALLSCSGFAVGVVLGYPPWFRIGAGITALVMAIQTIQSYSFRYFLRNASDESTRLATFMGLGRRRSILKQVGPSEEMELKSTDSQSMHPSEGIESEP